MSDSLNIIRLRLAEIEAMRAKLDEEEEELSIAERVLARLEAGSTSGNGAARGKSNRAPSQTDVIVATLKSSARPWFETTKNLLEAIKVIHGVEMKKTSFHPLVSQLVKSGVITRNGLKVALAERVKGGAETNQAAE